MIAGVDGPAGTAGVAGDGALGPVGAGEAGAPGAAADPAAGVAVATVAGAAPRVLEASGLVAKLLTGLARWPGVAGTAAVLSGCVTAGVGAAEPPGTA
jgi:hypothetical protein